MRALGAILMGLGATLGAGVALAMVAGPWSPLITSLPWLVAVGLAKVTFVNALGLIAAGAVVRRLASRAEQRALMPEARASAEGDDR